jgi:putative glutamine amidotransferase
MARPVFGITCCNRSLNGEVAQAVMLRYAAAAMKYADAAAVLIPALPEFAQAEEAAARVDGILLTGSPSNVEPHRYGQPNPPDAAGPYDPRRDAMAAGLIRAAVADGKPVFGICRGFQEMNLAFGGTLRRDCASNPDLLAHHAPPEADLEALFDQTHPVALTPGGTLAQAYGRTGMQVNSVHFQGVDRVGEGLRVEARSPDGLVEALSGTFNGSTLLGVQWHPEWQVERRADSQLFFVMFGRALRGEPLAPASRRPMTP